MLLTRTPKKYILLHILEKRLFIYNNIEKYYKEIFYEKTTVGCFGFIVAQSNCFL